MLLSRIGLSLFGPGNSTDSNHLRFEWDPNKEQANIRRHGIDFGIASRVFYDRQRVVLYDTRHSDDEDRYTTIGYLPQLGRMIIVMYTMRNGDSIRIISARSASKHEEEVYYDRT